MSFDGTVTYDDTHETIKLLFHDSGQLTSFYNDYIATGLCRFIMPPIDEYFYFHYTDTAHYLADKVTVAALLAAL